jgi:hypothetical protein
MQDTETVAIGDRSNEQVDGREAVVAGPGELALRLDCTLLDLHVDVKAWKRQQLGE